MMSEFCSNTQIFFCSGYWKCILREQDFKIFPWGHAPRPPVKLTPSALRRCEVFPPPPILQSFCHLLITLLKTLIYCYQNPVPAQSLMTQTQYISASKVMEYTQVGFLPDFLPVNVCQSFSFSIKWLSTFICKLRKQHSQ